MNMQLNACAHADNFGVCLPPSKKRITPLTAEESDSEEQNVELNSIDKYTSKGLKLFIYMNLDVLLSIWSKL